MRLYEFTEQQVTEVAPPGMEDWINDRKAEFKKRYGDKWQQVLYATAWKQHNESLGEAAPTAVRAVSGATVGAVTGIGGALIGSMFGGVLGSVAGAAFGGVTGANAGVNAADAIWDKVASMFGSDEKAAQYGIAHAQAAQAGWQNFQFNGKTYPVTLKPQEAKPAVDALNAVKEGIVPAEKLDELTGWTQAAPKRATPQPKKPTFAELIKKSDDKRSTLQRQKDGGKKNWFAEEELEEASWINGVKQDDKELVWKQTGMSYEKAVEQYGKEHVRLGGKNKLGQQTVQVHVPLVAEAQNDYFKRRKDEEDRIAGTKAPAKRTPKQTDYEKKRKQQGVAEGSDWHGSDTDRDWYDGYKDAPVRVKVKNISGMGGQPSGTYTVRSFTKVGPNNAEFTVNSQGREMTASLDLDNPRTYIDKNYDKQYAYDFYSGRMPITPRQAFNLIQVKKQPNNIGKKGVAEGYAGIDDTDTVGFYLDSEAAYTAVMAKFGEHIDYDETDGIMYVPASMWPNVEAVAFDADGVGATKDYDFEHPDSPEQDMAEGTQSTTWVVHYDYGPHQSNEVKVKASSEDDARAKAVRWAKNHGHSSIMINRASPAEQGVAENEKIGGRHEPEEFDAMLGRLKKLAGQGELKTVWDPIKRVYKNVPINQDNK